MTFISALSKFNRNVEKLIKPSIAIALLSITFMLCMNVVARYIIGFSIKWAEELSNYTMIYVTFFGAVVCVPLGMHTSMDALIDKIGERYKKIVIRINVSIGFIFSFIISFFGYQLLVFVIERKQVSPAMMVPMVIPYIAIPTASIFIGLEFLEILIKGNTIDISDDKSSD